MGGPFLQEAPACPSMYGNFVQWLLQLVVSFVQQNNQRLQRIDSGPRRHASTGNEHEGMRIIVMPF